jgi:hypothetical protein
MLDKQGNEVTNKDDMYGRPTKFHLTHPEKLIFVDELGDIISQANDGNKTGTKYVTGKGWRAQQKNSFTDYHYTTLGFTAATGEPVMCAIIIAADRLKDHETVGFNCCSPDWKEGVESWNEDEIGGLLTEDNMRGLNKIFPCGPTSEFAGKTVPCLFGWTPKGSITGALLAAMLRKMDDLEMFNLFDGINPFILLDGHGSRFEFSFVEYIHGDREWTVCIGVPYGISLWQVGDSKQQNGQYKDKSKEGKENVLTMKRKHGLRFTIIKEDKMWLVHYAWDKSFARVNTNAIVKRGWGALNYVLLDHPELKTIRDRVEMVRLSDDGDRYFTQESLYNLNTTEGIAGDTVDLLMEEKVMLLIIVQSLG